MNGDYHFLSKFKMNQFSLLMLKFFFVASYDPAKIDYCNTFCDKYVSSACRCAHAKDRTYVTTKMQEFRQLMLDTHNELRDRFAKGDEEQLNFEPAADMHILKYDLELEHLARCHIMRSNFTHRHDNCRQVSFCESFSAPGQNIAGINSTKWSNTILKNLIKEQWYEQYKNIPKLEEFEPLIAKFEPPPYNIKYFTQLIWAETAKIGCARAIIPNNPYAKFKFVLVCNYAGPPENCAGNFPGNSIYSPGRPCKKCFQSFHTTCNKDLGGKYEALCGEDVKAPNDPPANLNETHKDLTDQSNRNIVHKLLIVFIVIFQVINNGFE